MEKWKTISDLNYEVSTRGRVKNSKTKQILKPTPDARGYVVMGLVRGGKKITLAIHRAVAEAFLPNPSRLETVNHKNGVKSDNDVDNLEWASRRDNQLHAISTGLQKLRNSPVAKLSLSGDILAEFESITAASAETGINMGNISSCTSATRLTAGGFMWRKLI